MSLFMEIGQTAWQVAVGADVVEFPLERADDGALTEACRLRVMAGLRAIVNKLGWASRRRAFVALGARGVSLRRFLLPQAPKDELERLVRLQIESEFPLSPDELAWGWQSVGQNSGRQDILVAAVKKGVVEGYAKILSACGVNPVFTFAGLARMAVCPPPLPSCSILYMGKTESELVSFENAMPASMRVLAAGSPLPRPVSGSLYLTGPLARSAGGTLPVLEGGSAIAGLKKLTGDGAGTVPLAIHNGESRTAATGENTWKWAVAAAALLVALISFPYAEAMVLQPHLTRKLAKIEVDRTRLPAIDRELNFLQYIKRTQPPYLDTIYLVSKLAPQGTSFESLAMTRKGEFSIRGVMPNAQQVTEFRSNLVQSAWFSSVVVEEQTPGQNQQVTVRMTAQLKPVDSRKPLVVEVPPSKNDHETNSAAPATKK
jgi:hypothetical protein